MGQDNGSDMILVKQTIATCLLLRSYTEIAQLSPQVITKANGNVSEKDICQWFQSITEQFKKENFFGALFDSNESSTMKSQTIQCLT